VQKCEAECVLYVELRAK